MGGSISPTYLHAWWMCVEKGEGNIPGWPCLGWAWPWWLAHGQEGPLPWRDISGETCAHE